MGEEQTAVDARKEAESVYVRSPEEWRSWAIETAVNVHAGQGRDAATLISEAKQLLAFVTGEPAGP
jgi:hypothetical protein